MLFRSGRGPPRGALEAELEQRGYADIDGTKVSTELWEAVRSFEPGPAGAADVTIIQVGPKHSPTGGTARLAERIGAGVEVAVSPPFWVESERMEIEPVRLRLRSVLGGRDGRDG